MDARYQQTEMGLRCDSGPAQMGDTWQRARGAASHHGNNGFYVELLRGACKVQYMSPQPRGLGHVQSPARP